METIEDIIKQRLQERVKTVMSEYQNGDIREEVEHELKATQKKEKIRNIARQSDVSGFKNKLYIWWLIFSHNDVYYHTIHQKHGNDVYWATALFACSWVCLVLFLIPITLCYTFGWYAVDNATEYYMTILEQKSSSYSSCPMSLTLAYTFLGFVPCFIPMCFMMISRRKNGLLLLVPTLLWLIHFFFIMKETFPQFFVLEQGIISGGLIAVLISIVLVYLIMQICMSIYCD